MVWYGYGIPSKNGHLPLSDKMNRRDKTSNKRVEASVKALLGFKVGGRRLTLFVMS